MWLALVGDTVVFFVSLWPKLGVLGVSAYFFLNALVHSSFRKMAGYGLCKIVVSRHIKTVHALQLSICSPSLLMTD